MRTQPKRAHAGTPADRPRDGALSGVFLATKKIDKLQYAKNEVQHTKKLSKFTEAVFANRVKGAAGGSDLTLQYEVLTEKNSARRASLVRCAAHRQFASRALTYCVLLCHPHLLQTHREKGAQVSVGARASESDELRCCTLPIRRL